MTFWQVVRWSAKVGAPGLVNFVTAVAFQFCPSLPESLTQPCASILADLCTVSKSDECQHEWARNDSVGEGGSLGRDLWWPPSITKRSLVLRAQFIWPSIISLQRFMSTNNYLYTQLIKEKSNFYQSICDIFCGLNSSSTTLSLERNWALMPGWSCKSS